jgi:hypothetical protein
MAFRYSGSGWRVAHAIRTFGDQIMALRGHTNSYPVDGTVGDLAHSNRVSDHNPDENGIVRALDFYEHKPGFVDEVFEVMRLARDPRVKYAIHDKRMFASYDAVGGPAWQWREYTGPNGHVTHGHLSVLPTGDNDSRPFQLIEEDDMATPQEIWFHLISDPITGTQRGAQALLAFARQDAYQAKVNSAVAVQLAREAAQGNTLSDAQVEAIAAAVADGIAAEVANELAQRLTD